MTELESKKRGRSKEMPPMVDFDWYLDEFALGEHSISDATLDAIADGHGGAAAAGFADKLHVKTHKERACDEVSSWSQASSSSSTSTPGSSLSPLSETSSASFTTSPHSAMSAFRSPWPSSASLASSPRYEGPPGPGPGPGPGPVKGALVICTASEMEDCGAKPAWSVPLTKRALRMPRSLGRPLVSADGQLVVVGTDDSLSREALSSDKKEGKLLITECSPESGQGSVAVASVGPSCVRDLEWLEQGERALVATGTDLSLLTLDGAGLSETRVSPLTGAEECCFSMANLREMSLEPTARSLMLSGGSDRAVHVWDPSRPTARAQVRMTTSGEVGSLNWHPSGPHVVSWTLDIGLFEMLDVRTATTIRHYDVAGWNMERTQARTRARMYSHEYVDDNTVLLGFANGSVSIVDVRQSRELGGWKDDTVSVFGELRCCPTRLRCAAFGVGGFSVKNLSDSNCKTILSARTGTGANSPLASPNNNRLPLDACKTEGTWVDAHRLMVTDSGGNLALYDLNTKNEKL